MVAHSAAFHTLSKACFKKEVLCVLQVFLTDNSSVVYMLCHAAFSSESMLFPALSLAVLTKSMSSGLLKRETFLIMPKKR